MQPMKDQAEDHRMDFVKVCRVILLMTHEINERNLLIYKRKEKKSHLFNIRNAFFPVKTQRVTLV